MTRSYSPLVILSAATDQACRPLAAVSSRSVDSQVKPSPSVYHSIPRCSASLRSPTFHFSLFTNCTTHVVQPRAHARPITPMAADVFPLPVPVLIRNLDCCGMARDPTARRAWCPTSGGTVRLVSPAGAPVVRGWCPGVFDPLLTGDGWLVRVRCPGGVISPAGAAAGGRSGGRRRLGPDRADVAGEPAAARPARGRARRHGPGAGRGRAGRCRCPDGRLAGDRRQPPGRSRPGGGGRHRPARGRTGGTPAHRSRRSAAEQVRGRRRRRRELAARARGRRPAPPPRAGRWLVGRACGGSIATDSISIRWNGSGTGTTRARSRSPPLSLCAAEQQRMDGVIAARGPLAPSSARSASTPAAAIGAALDHRRPARPARTPRSRTLLAGRGALPRPARRDDAPGAGRPGRGRRHCRHSRPADHRPVTGLLRDPKGSPRRPCRTRLEELGLLTTATDPRAQLSACVGSRGCEAARADTWAEAERLAERMPRPDGGRVHLSGCEKACGAPRDVTHLVAVGPGHFEERTVTA